ncbi:ANTAR domain-containing response regulator [Nakamurella sp.]|uniref:ANTAR domain-containing response regulator n=1 Tax=Nakamurella sp. TaxID=1869182 RepID=UPI003B3A96BB
MNALRPGTPGPGGAGPAAVQADASAPVDGRVRSAVVVDRDEAVRTAVEGLLERMGFQIAARADDPALMSGLVRDGRPDVVVLAIGSGPDDLAALADLTAARIAPVVVLTDEVTPERVAAVRDAGAHGLLPAFPSRVSLLPAIELAIARFAEVARLTAEVEAAARRLETRKLIDRAKGLLMTHRGLTEPEAFRWIQRTAMDRRKSSAVVAAQVIAEFEQAPIRTAS